MPIAHALSAPGKSGKMVFPLHLSPAALYFTEALSMQLEAAVSLSLTVYDGIPDKAGIPYWTHPFRVMLRLGASATNDERIAALLHDAVEDTIFKEKELRAAGVPDAAIYLILGCTHPKYLGRPEVSYRAWIDEIAAHPPGTPEKPHPGRIKLADINDNSDPVRLVLLPDPMSYPRDRYKAAIKVLEQCLPEAMKRGVLYGNLSDSQILDLSDALGLRRFGEQLISETKEALRRRAPMASTPLTHLAAPPAAKVYP